MLRKKYRLCGVVGAVAAAVLFGTLAAGCGKDTPTGSETPPELNGKWVSEESILTLNKGSFEISMLDEELGAVRVLKGKFSTSDNIFTLKPTHVHGDMFNAGASEGGMPISSKWYTKKELKAELKKMYGALLSLFGVNVDEALDEILDEALGEMLTARTGTYSLDGDTLIITIDDDPETFTRQ